MVGIILLSMFLFTLLKALYLNWQQIVRSIEI